MRVHLAGTSPLGHSAQLAAATPALMDHPWRLVSYMDLAASLPEVVGVTDPESMIVDSGLFALMFGSKQQTMPATFEAYRRYTLEYLEALDRVSYKGLLVECDTHKLLGMDATFRLREEFKPLGDRVIYTWHAPEGIAGLFELARSRSYIALSVPELRVFFGGSFALGSKEYTVALWKLLAEIHKACAAEGSPRIHLLGCTTLELMQTPLAWSCDSTSWLSGVRYGKGWVYEGSGKLKMRPMRSREFVAWRTTVYRERLTPELRTLADSRPYGLNELACAAAYSDYQRWLDARISPRAVRGYTT